MTQAPEHTEEISWVGLRTHATKVMVRRTPSQQGQGKEGTYQFVPIRPAKTHISSVSDGCGD